MKKTLALWFLLVASFVWLSSFATGSVLQSWSSCQDVRKSAQVTVTTNLKTIRTSTLELKKKYGGRWMQYIAKNKRSEAQKLNQANREEIRKLHKDLVKKYYENPSSVSSTLYTDQILAVRSKFITALSGSLASGKKADFDLFASDYMAMFRDNRSLRFANVVARYNAHKVCQEQQDKISKERLEKNLNKLKDKTGKIEKRYEKSAKKLQDALATLEEKKHKLIQKLWERDYKEDSGRDNEPSN